MGGIRELLNGKLWEWDLSFRWEWESLKWEGIGTKNLFPHSVLLVMELILVLVLVSFQTNNFYII